MMPLLLAMRGFPPEEIAHAKNITKDLENAGWKLLSVHINEYEEAKGIFVRPVKQSLLYDASGNPVEVRLVFFL